MNDESRRCNSQPEHDGLSQPAGNLARIPLHAPKYQTNAALLRSLIRFSWIMSGAAP